MKKGKQVLAMAMAAAMMMGLAACGNGDGKESENPGEAQYKVGIIQQMEHVALDQAREAL